MSLLGKLEANVVLKIPAQQYYEILSSRQHHVNTMSPGKIQSCDLHEGEWGKVGKIIYWRYTHDGKPKVAKEIVEDIDNKNLSVTFKVIEGDVMEEYKNMKLISKAIPKEGGGSVVHWTLEYEKLHEGIPDPHSLLDFLINLTKDICSHHSDK